MFEFLEPVNTLPGERTFINVINVTILGWGIRLNYPEESSMITEILINERERQEGQYQSEETWEGTDWPSLPVKVEEEARTQGMQAYRT